MEFKILISLAGCEAQTSHVDDPQLGDAGGNKSFENLSLAAIESNNNLTSLLVQINSTDHREQIILVLCGVCPHAGSDYDKDNSSVGTDMYTHTGEYATT